MHQENTVTQEFNDISLLVTVYNRSESLKRLLQSFVDLGISFGEIVVSDDASSDEHQENMKTFIPQYGIRLIAAERNGGLGRNLNKGQKAVTKPYTLYIQEDFIPKPAFAQNISAALEIMKAEKSIDTVRFYAYFPYPYVSSFNEKFYEMNFKPSMLYWNHLKFYMYSDHPHLRRSSFNEKFGDYLEGVHSDLTEFDMCLSYLKAGGRGLISKNFQETVEQENSPDEPSTVSRKSWKEQDTPLINAARKVFLGYRFIKNTIQLKLR